MFNWYARSYRCYAFLEDVSAIDIEGELSKSRWFTRGWTLQELIAPPLVVFYDAAWTTFGTRRSLAPTIARITRIDLGFLIAGILSPWSYGNRLDSLCIAKKMSWAAYRETTRKEDEAYCLMGIFGINMPLLYGEGEKAFVRLQEEIVKKNNSDDSILAWDLESERAISSARGAAYNIIQSTLTGEILASSPLEFKNCGGLEMAPATGPLLTLDSVGISTRLPLVSMQVTTAQHVSEKLLIGLLSCSFRANKSSHMLGILLTPKEWSIHAVSPRHMVRRSTLRGTKRSRTVLVTCRDALESTDFQQITIVPYLHRGPAGPALYNRSYVIDETPNIWTAGLRLLHVEGWYGNEYPQFGGQMPQKRDMLNWDASSRTYTRIRDDPPIHVLSLAYSSRDTHPDVAFTIHLEMSLNLATVYGPSGPRTEHDMRRVWDALRDRSWQTDPDRVMYTHGNGRQIHLSVDLKEKRTIQQWRIFSVEIDVVDVSQFGSRVTS